MSLKSVELQFALHKNDEVGIKQNQMAHKPVLDQAVLADTAEKEAIKDGQQAAKLSESVHQHIHDQLPHQKHGGRNRRGNVSKNLKDEPKSKERSEHPYKGHHIDLSL